MKVFYDKDANLDILKNKTLGIIGYGNQERRQAQNLRDSGFRIIIGCLHDESARQAEADGFKVHPIAEATEQADVVSLLIPDEAQRQVYDEVIGRRLRIASNGAWGSC